MRDVAKITEAAIRRRVRFLIDEAGSPDPCYDQTVRYALRVISNYYSVGNDLSSGQIKQVSTRISRSALKLRCLYEVVHNDKHKKWRKETINEHPDELVNIWEWIKTNHQTLAIDQIITRIKACPIVIVTKREDRRLKSAKNGEARRAI